MGGPWTYDCELKAAEYEGGSCVSRELKGLIRIKLSKEMPARAAQIVLGDSFLPLVARGLERNVGINGVSGSSYVSCLSIIP